jgi:RND family efflux transporter MFP subunit
MKQNIITLAMAIGLITILQACTDTKGNDNIPKASDPVPVRIVEPSKSTGTNTIKASGQLTTNDETILGFKTAGIIRSILVKEGDAVKKGQLLATLDLREVDAHVSQARHGYEKARRDFERVQNLFKDSVATLEQLENAETGLAVAKEQLDIADFNKGFSAIHATTNGYVLRKFVNAGQVVDVGDPILMTNGAADGKWILKVGVSDRQWSGIEAGDKAKVTIDAFNVETFNGSVIRKWETSDAQTGAFTVEVEVKGSNTKFASGMFGSAEFVSDSRASWSVPFEAVLDANDNEGFVFITNDYKTAVKQPVVIESFDENSIRISSGLEDAKAIIISGSAYLTDNSPISVLK